MDACDGSILMTLAMCSLKGTVAQLNHEYNAALPHLSSDLARRAAAAIVDNRPLYEGDDLYDIVTRIRDFAAQLIQPVPDHRPE